MPDFTRIETAELDIARKLYAQNARAMLLERVEDIAAWTHIEGFWDNNGILKKSWAPFDFKDGIHLRIKVAQLAPITDEILNKVEGIAFWRDTKIKPNEAHVFVVTDVEYPEIFSSRIYTFYLQKLEPYVSSGFDYTFNDFVLT